MLYDLELTKSIRWQVFSMLTWKKPCKFMAANSNQHKSVASSPSSFNCIRARWESQGPKRQRNDIFTKLRALSPTVGKYTLQCNWQFSHPTGCSYFILTHLSNWYVLMPSKTISGCCRRGSGCHWGSPTTPDTSWVQEEQSCDTRRGSNFLQRTELPEVSGTWGCVASNDHIIWLPWWISGKESTCQYRRWRFAAWVGKIPLRRKWQPTPEFLPGESHGQRSLVGYIQSTGSPRGRHYLGTKQEHTEYPRRLMVLPRVRTKLPLEKAFTFQLVFAQFDRRRGSIREGLLGSDQGQGQQ